MTLVKNAVSPPKASSHRGHFHTLPPLPFALSFDLVCPNLASRLCSALAHFPLNFKKNAFHTHSQQASRPSSFCSTPGEGNEGGLETRDMSFCRITPCPEAPSEAELLRYARGSSATKVPCSQPLPTLPQPSPPLTICRSAAGGGGRWEGWGYLGSRSPALVLTRSST